MSTSLAASVAGGLPRRLKLLAMSAFFGGVVWEALDIFQPDTFSATQTPS